MCEGTKGGSWCIPLDDEFKRSPSLTLPISEGGILGGRICADLHGSCGLPT